MNKQISEVPTRSYNLNNPKKALELAKVLQQYVKDNNLTSKIIGKEYVNVEGWQFAGTSLGIVPIMISCDQMESDKFIKYKATVELQRITNGQLIGRAFAICSTQEKSKQSFDEYAIASMAQTRAIGKAYRNCIGWMMKAAGYEATPSEEMDEVRQGKETTISEEVTKKVANFSDRESLIEYAKTCDHLHKNLEFRKLIKDRENELAKSK